MTHNKKNPHNSERNGDGQNDPKAHPNGVIHFIIHHKNKGAQSNTNYRKDYTSDIFPFPCNNKKGK